MMLFRKGTKHWDRNGNEGRGKSHTDSPKTFSRLTSGFLDYRNRGRLINVHQQAVENQALQQLYETNCLRPEVRKSTFKDFFKHNLGEFML